MCICFDEDVKERMGRLYRPTIAHGVILSVIKANTQERPWFGTRRGDWYELGWLSDQQYYKAMQELRDEGIIQTRRSAELYSSIPLTYHALSGQDLAPPDPRCNAIVYKRETTA